MCTLLVSLILFVAVPFGVHKFMCWEGTHVEEYKPPRQVVNAGVGGRADA